MMITAFIGALSALLAAGLHGVFVRWLPRSLQLLSIPVLGFLCAVTLGGQLPLMDQLISILASSSLSIAYMFAFVAVIYDSPTMALANAIIDHGEKGMPMTALDNFVSRHPFVETRAQALLDAGVLRENTEGALIIVKTGFAMRILMSYRRLCGLQHKAG